MRLRTCKIPLKDTNYDLVTVWKQYLPIGFSAITKTGCSTKKEAFIIVALRLGVRQKKRDRYKDDWKNWILTG